MRLIYLLGYPVAHSVSPVIQNAAIRALGLDSEYRLKPVPPGQLGRAIEELREDSIAGFNVTTPHKVEILDLLDEVDPTAKMIGAVNTVINTGGVLKGYNTDCVAAVRALMEVYGDLGGCRVLILGSGGAARAVAYGLAPYAGWIRIINRDAVKAELLVEEVRSRTGAFIESCGIDEVRDVVGSADILINATPVGMSPNSGCSPVDAKVLHSGLTVFDLVYNPECTMLLRDAEAAGARTLGGLKMLVYQGMEAFRLWTGTDAPEGLMLGAAHEALRGVSI